MEDAAPLIQDEDGAGHKCGRSVFAGGVGDDDLGVIDVRHGGKGGVNAGDGGDKMDAAVIFAQDVDENCTDTNPKDGAKAAALGGALIWDGGRSKTVGCAKTRLDEIHHSLKGGEDTLENLGIKAETEGAKGHH